MKPHVFSVRLNLSSMPVTSPQSLVQAQDAIASLAQQLRAAGWSVVEGDAKISAVRAKAPSGIPAIPEPGEIPEPAPV